MHRMLRRAAALLALLMLLPAGALALTGQSMTTFLTYYKENISYLNDIEDRHMLPAELTAIDLNDAGRTQYVSQTDALLLTINVDAAGIIENCEIRLLYPEGAQPGNSLHLDYVTAQYHSVAFIMAMHVSSTPESRLLLAAEIQNALSNNFGVYERQLGSYSISCISVVGEGAVFAFTNNGLQPDDSSPEDGGQTPAPIEDDEQANYG